MVCLLTVNVMGVIVIMANEKLLRVPDAARRLGISPQTLKRMIEAKRIHAVKVNFQWRVPESAVVRYLEEHSNIQEDDTQ